MAKVILLGSIIKVGERTVVKIDSLDDVLEAVGFTVNETVYVTIQSCNDGTENNNQLRNRD